MPQRFSSHLVFALAASVFVNACGGSPTTPPPPPPPPTNAMPVISSITVQGRRAGQPARFADVRETVDVAATVSDAETPIDELIYQWTATAGTFNGTGRNVTWTAPDTATTPATVTITLKVIENYGHPGQPKTFSHDVSRTQTLALHDSVKEIGDMARLFLTEFSKPQTNQDWRDVMKDFDFNNAACPDPRLVEDERLDVVNHYTNFFMHHYEIGPATVSVGFGDGCHVPQRAWRPGDACIRVPVVWDSTDMSQSPPFRPATPTTGVDWLTAAYAASGTRWWLCSSDFPPPTTLGHPFYSSGR